MAVAAIHINQSISKDCIQCGAAFYRDKRCTWAYWGRAKYCSSACAGLANTERAARDRLSMRDNFERWIDKSGECWLWTGACARNGYGAFSHASVTRRAHVVALELDGRMPAKGEYACHHCDNPACVRPSHLYAGTPAQNSADAVARGRVQRGERQHMAKLTERAVREIRASSAGSIELAKRYGVSCAAVYMVRSGKTWKHVA